jgi:pimeloyl-ACP methyl ester carboxylesterase
MQVVFLIAGVIAFLLLAAGYFYQRAGASMDEKRNPAPGQKVTLGGRAFHLLCRGSGGPAVVIEPGAGELAELWWPMQDKVSAFACVCTYDRAGYGWSDPAPSSRTIQQRAEALHDLLANSGVPAPYILVGHSYGGLIVRWFAHQYRHQVAGLVLVDTPEESTLFQPDVLRLYARIRVVLIAMRFAAYFGLPRLLLARFPALRGNVFANPREYAAAADDLASLHRVEPALRKPGGFGALADMPLAVITHGQPFPGPFAVLEGGWSEGQKRLAALSGNSVLIVAGKSNHMIHIDEPELVAHAIRRVHSSASEGQRLVFAQDSNG